MTHCFENYGLKARTVSPFANCMDICKEERPEEECNCPHY